MMRVYSLSVSEQYFCSWCPRGIVRECQFANQPKSVVTGTPLSAILKGRLVGDMTTVS